MCTYYSAYVSMHWVLWSSLKKSHWFQWFVFSFKWLHCIQCPLILAHVDKMLHNGFLTQKELEIRGWIKAFPPHTPLHSKSLLLQWKATSPLECCIKNIWSQEKFMPCFGRERGPLHCYKEKFWLINGYSNWEYSLYHSSCTWLYLIEVPFQLLSTSLSIWRYQFCTLGYKLVQKLTI